MKHFQVEYWQDGKWNIAGAYSTSEQAMLQCGTCRSVGIFETRIIYTGKKMEMFW